MCLGKAPPPARLSRAQSTCPREPLPNAKARLTTRWWRRRPARFINFGHRCIGQQTLFVGSLSVPCIPPQQAKQTLLEKLFSSPLLTVGYLCQATPAATGVGQQTQHSRPRPTLHQPQPFCGIFPFSVFLSIFLFSRKPKAKERHAFACTTWTQSCSCGLQLQTLWPPQLQPVAFMPHPILTHPEHTTCLNDRPAASLAGTALFASRPPWSFTAKLSGPCSLPRQVPGFAGQATDTLRPGAWGVIPVASRPPIMARC